jgi:phosphoribosylaminoimidazole-succinocarboxamide synthase
MEFDLELLVEQRAAAADLTDAEKGLEAVMEYARELGVVFADSKIESGFQDHIDDGYRLSMEADMVQHVDRSRIEKWMAEKEDRPNHSTDCDDWDSRTVELYDSISVVAEGKEKARIEKWRKLCEENKVKIPSELAREDLEDDQ